MNLDDTLNVDDQLRFVTTLNVYEYSDNVNELDDTLPQLYIVNLDNSFYVNSDIVVSGVLFPVGQLVYNTGVY